MKRKENRVPKFDEIIFENRNREYGAYDLRRRSKSVTSFSILAAVAICVTLVTVSFRTKENISGPARETTNIVATLDNYDPNMIRVEPPAAPPEELVRVIQNVAPVIVTDTALVTSFIPITEELTRLVTNGDVTDTIAYIPEEIEEVVSSEPEVYIRVEEMPEYPGGDKALLEYIAKNLQYPQDAIENNIQGRVFIQFVVQPDGMVGRVEVLKGVDVSIDNEAIRVIKSLPKLKPGKQNGIPVPVWFSVPVTFQIKY